MKMTKIFAMALAALTIASCSKSEEIGGSNNGTGGEEINTPTYATFKFNIGGPSSRAVTDFNPATAAEADAADKLIGGKLQLLIFNAVTQKLEHNSLVDAGGAKTVLLTAGRKKIFVVANNDKLPYKALIEPTNAFQVGVKSLSDFYALNFNAGVPKQITADQTGARGFDFALLHTAADNNAGLPMSNTNELTYTLVAGISESQASGGAGSASTNGTSDTNSFNIKLYYMVAKARLTLADGVLEPTGDAVSDPIIQKVTYSIRNLARVTNYTQNVPTAGNPQSFYYTEPFTESSAQTAFDDKFDYASNLSVAATATPGNYLYVPENNHSMLRRGQSSYFAIKAEFQPVVISVVKYDLNNFVKYTYAKLATADAANKNYIYTTKDVHGIPAGTYFLTVALLEEAAWMMVNKIPFVEATHRTAAQGLVTPPDTPAPYMSFAGGISYYRVDLGDGAGGAETTYGVLRSNKYDATINQITGPGVPSEQDLITKPHDPVLAKTYIDATITAAEWAPLKQSADL